MPHERPRRRAELLNELGNVLHKFHQGTEEQLRQLNEDWADASDYDDLVNDILGYLDGHPKCARNAYKQYDVILEDDEVYDAI